MGVLSFFCIVCIVPNGKIYSHALMMRCPVAAVAAGNLMVRDRWDSVGRQRDAQSCVFCINRCFRSGMDVRRSCRLHEPHEDVTITQPLARHSRENGNLIGGVFKSIEETVNISPQPEIIYVTND